MTFQVEYLPDSSIDPATDANLRDLLATCFTKPQDYVFRERRYFTEPYPHRWVIRDPGGVIIAHVGMHVKEIRSGGETFRIGGIAEVSVHPDYRGRGFVKKMLIPVHAFQKENGFPYSVLLGDPRVYTSSGYRVVENLHFGGDTEGWKQIPVMAHEVAGIPWPEGAAYLRGPKF